MKPQSAKAKGRVFQQDIRNLILKTYPQLENDDVKSTSMGAGGEDVQLSPAARKILPIQIECKRVKSAKTIYGWLDQANTHGDYLPVVFIRADREKPLAILPAEVCVELLEHFNGQKK